jgi:hypothetical protein
VLRQLSLYLRIADSLYRSHVGVVQQVRLHAAGKSFVLEIRSGREQALGRKLVIRP